MIHTDLMRGAPAVGPPAAAYLVLFTTAYAALSALGAWLVLTPGQQGVFWPPSGLFVAALLLSEPRDWWRWIVGAFFAEVVTDVIVYDYSVAVSLLIFVGNMLEAIAGAYLVRRWCGTPFRFHTVRDVLGLTMLAAVVSPVLSATVGASTLTLAGLASFGQTWLTWWSGDAVGIMIVAPLVLVMVERGTRWREITAARWAEAASLLLALVAIYHFVFTGDFPFAYIVMPTLMWSALRFGLLGAALAMAILSVMTVRYTAASSGMFAGPAFTLETQAFLVHLFLGISSVSALVLAALTQQRRAAHQALQRANNELEDRVNERTAALRESEERLRLALDGGSLGTWHRDMLTGEGFRDDRANAILGFTDKTNFSETDFWSAVHPDDRSKMIAARRRAITEHDEYSTEFRFTRPDGSPVWVLNKAKPFYDESGRVTRLSGISMDITERKQAEERLREFNAELERQVEERTAELRIAQEQLRALTARVHLLQEEERAQLARELHDEFGAALTALKVDLHWILSRLPEWLHGMKAKARAMSDLMDNTLDAVRRTASLLRPRLLDDFGLVAAIEWQCKDFERRTGVRCLTTLPEDFALDLERCTALFRILQEALTNVSRHARATEVAIRLQREPDRIWLEVKDNGVGISPEAIANDKSFGLFGMQERAYVFGGHVRFAGESGQGTTVTVEVPLAEASQGGHQGEKRQSTLQRHEKKKSNRTSVTSQL